MKFHAPSFLLGCAVGAAAIVVFPKLRPVLVEAAGSVYKVYDAVMARLAMAREDFEDFLAEARAWARAPRAVPEPAPEGPVANA